MSGKCLNEKYRGMTYILSERWSPWVSLLFSCCVEFSFLLQFLGGQMIFAFFKGCLLRIIVAFIEPSVSAVCVGVKEEHESNEDLDYKTH